MSREIKFRAWNSVTKEMEQVTQINLKNHYVQTTFNKIGYSYGQPDDVIVEQYTGLKDANGKDIYEGDILHFGSVWCVGDEYDPREEDHTGLVEYRPDYASYVVNCNGKIYPLEQVISFNGYSVQGNVHENPELLEADK